MCKPLCNRRGVARDVRGRVLECGRFLPENVPEAVLRDLRRFLARA